MVEVAQADLIERATALMPDLEEVPDAAEPREYRIEAAARAIRTWLTLEQAEGQTSSMAERLRVLKESHLLALSAEPLDGTSDRAIAVFLGHNIITKEQAFVAS